MQKITPCLWFDMNCEEALNFYCSIFKNTKIVSIQRYPDGPLEGPIKGMEGKVLTAIFELEGQRFMALDGGPIFKPTEAISFQVEVETQEELDGYWDRLIEGGPIESQQCGWLKDKYGFSWQIVPKKLGELLQDSDKVKSKRAMDAMMQMKKLDIAVLQKAFDGE